MIILDPLSLKDFSQFQDMEHICFPCYERRSLVVDLTKEEERSRTPKKTTTVIKTHITDYQQKKSPIRVAP